MGELKTFYGPMKPGDAEIVTINDSGATWLLLCVPDGSYHDSDYGLYLVIGRAGHVNIERANRSWHTTQIDQFFGALAVLRG